MSGAHVQCLDKPNDRNASTRPFRKRLPSVAVFLSCDQRSRSALRAIQQSNVFGAKTMTKFNRFQLALDIQNAGNLRAIAREFVRVVDDAMAETQSTTATWDDAAVVLMVNKMESLCRSEDRFSAAYKLAQARAER
jgi:hypothetical protein